MLEQDDTTMFSSIAIGVVLIFVVIFVLGLLCGLLGLILEEIPKEAGFIDSAMALALVG